MFVYRTQIRLKDTDATGVLYFAQQFPMAMEAWEECLKARGFPLQQLLDSPYLMPVVHAEADYLAPLRVGDEVEITLTVAKLGTSSVTLDFSLHDSHSKCAVGNVRIVHVVVDRESGSSVPIPDFLRVILEANYTNCRK
ncbi:MAG TPA: thioesterase family protein [Flavisolibacter sp.]|jgi:YbgC/YbaW family acyl-CoA thioester hydrolase|nr:thioesterase family protein [Flavisolibacter sp.]